MQLVPLLVSLYELNSLLKKHYNFWNRVESCNIFPVLTFQFMHIPYMRTASVNDVVESLLKNSCRFGNSALVYWKAILNNTKLTTTFWIIATKCTTPCPGIWAWACRSHSLRPLIFLMVSGQHNFLKKKITINFTTDHF